MALRRKSAGDVLTVVVDGHPVAATAESAFEAAAGGSNTESNLAFTLIDIGNPSAFHFQIPDGFGSISTKSY